MFKFLFAIPVLLFASCSSGKYIVFQNIGPTNKPIPCIVITQDKGLDTQFCEWQQKYFADEEKFLQVEKYIYSNDTQADTLRNLTLFGSFRVQIGNKVSYVIEGRQNAIVYFTNFD